MHACENASRHAKSLDGIQLDYASGIQKYHMGSLTDEKACPLAAGQDGLMPLTGVDDGFELERGETARVYGALGD